VRFIGRWLMIDIFMESLLGALVAFGYKRARWDIQTHNGQSCG
jgi:uncharacterized paraquat-inducible protein A